MQVSSEGMVCSIGMLFTMLCLVFTSILVAGWKMTKSKLLIPSKQTLVHLAKTAFRSYHNHQNTY